MEISEKILTYLSTSGKENKYRLASALKIDDWELTKALSALEEEGKIEIKDGRAILVKGKKSITKVGKLKKEPKIEEEQPVEEKIEQPQEEITKEEVQETEAKPEEGGERIEGTVNFFNPDKGFGFIAGDDGEEYYVHKSALRESVTIEANNRVSFKVVQGDKGPKAEEVEWISQA